MLGLRIVAQVLAVGIPILAGVLDYQWRDKRTRKFRRVKRLLFAVGFVLLIASVYLTIVDQRSHERESSALRVSIDRFRQGASQQAVQAEQRDRATQARLGQLLDGNHALEAQLDPFVRAADRLFPSSPPSSRLGRLEQQLSQLSQGVSELKSKSKDLEEKQAPWELTTEQKAVFTAQLISAPKGRVAIEYIRSDEARSRKFAVVLRDILKNAAYDVWGYMAGFMQADAPPLVGIQISIKDQKSNLVGGGLQRAFKAIGIQADGVHRSDQTYEDDFVVIYVGVKP